MRAKEFLINIPIHIVFNSDGSADVSAADPAPDEAPELDPNPIMIPPLQQKIELAKASVGKESSVIDKLIQPVGGPGDIADELG